MPDDLWVNLAYRPCANMAIQLHNNLDALGVCDVLDCLWEIATPTLVIAGHHDTTHPPSQSQGIRAGIPGAEFLLLEHGGHGEGAEEDHDRNPATVQRFLAGLPAETSACRRGAAAPWRQRQSGKDMTSMRLPLP